MKACNLQRVNMLRVGEVTPREPYILNPKGSILLAAHSAGAATTDDIEEPMSAATLMPPPPPVRIARQSPQRSPGNGTAMVRQ